MLRDGNPGATQEMYGRWCVFRFGPDAERYNTDRVLKSNYGAV